MEAVPACSVRLTTAYRRPQRNASAPRSRPAAALRALIRCRSSGPGTAPARIGSPHARPAARRPRPARRPDRRLDHPARPVHGSRPGALRRRLHDADRQRAAVGDARPPGRGQEVFTGDPATMHAGKANLVLRPLLGHASVLLLDGPQHMPQRKLMLPPFHGSRMAGYEALVREIAARARRGLAARRRRPALTAAAGDHARRRAARDLRRRGRRERLAACATDCGAMLGRRDQRRRRCSTMSGDRPAATSSARGSSGAGSSPSTSCCSSRSPSAAAPPGDDVLSLLLAARHDDGTPMTDRELRDELVTLLVAGHETTATALGWTVERLVRTPGGWDALRAGGEDYAEAAAKEALRLRPVLPVVAAPPPGAGDDRRARAGGRDRRRALDLPRPPPPGALPGPGDVPARALPRARPAGRDLHVDPVRRRRAPLPRRRLRADGAARRARRGRRAGRGRAGPAAAGTDRTTRDHPDPGARRRGRLELAWGGPDGHERRQPPRAVPDRRELARLPRVLRAPGVDRHLRRAADERDLRLRLDAGEDPHRPRRRADGRGLGRRACPAARRSPPTTRRSAPRAPTCSSSSGRTCSRSSRRSATPTCPSRATRPTT